MICKLFDKHRQSYYDADKQEKKMDDLGERIAEKVKEIRKDLPGIGTLKLYFLLKDWLVSEKIKIGRDKFHEVLRSYGLLIKLVKGVRTTNSDHAYRKYADLRKDMQVEKPDKLWVSDITYLPVGSDFAYLSLVTDAYSRKILGWSVEEDLKSIGPVKALKQALQQRKNKQDKLDLIHHSDRGHHGMAFNIVQVIILIS
ncbi:DDE-type integrase/transposase/recombinase [Flexithrix dorotheae]|uniref:DDE-type integrase/transposase/recombinase n=1 Tax=Flexithrix dorotheae TaxID=70993 RepID=UPI0012FA3A18|nr:DDE-type integrase/transposase/recombinase [Flexithrix dorotheae]